MYPHWTKSESSLCALSWLACGPAQTVQRRKDWFPTLPGPANLTECDRWFLGLERSRRSVSPHPHMPKSQSYPAVRGRPAVDDSLLKLPAPVLYSIPDNGLHIPEVSPAKPEHARYQPSHWSAGRRPHKLQSSHAVCLE